MKGGIGVVTLVFFLGTVALVGVGSGIGSAQVLKPFSSVSQATTDQEFVRDKLVGKADRMCVQEFEGSGGDDSGSSVERLPVDDEKFFRHKFSSKLEKAELCEPEESDKQAFCGDYGDKSVTVYFQESDECEYTMEEITEGSEPKKFYIKNLNGDESDGGDGDSDGEGSEADVEIVVEDGG